MDTPITIAVVGAGDRGSTYSAWAAAHPDRARVVAVAEPRPDRLAAYVASFAPQRSFASWADLLAAGRIADAVLICTQDAAHTEPALAFLGAGWDVLLEKPMAPTLAECERICAAAGEAIFAVSHVLRYTPYTRLLRRLLAGGAIGDVVSIQHVEPIGWFHFAHSYVRGNWRRTDEAAPSLLTKSCHDIDWLGYVVGAPIVRASSFGSLAHFREAQAPSGSTARCLDCPLERTCAYSATRIYLDPARAGYTGWPLSVATPAPTPASIEAALREGPYGRCVYRCDNDVVDHQVVALEFAGGATGTFQMMAFTEMANRRTQIYGTQGELTGDGEEVTVFDFRTQERTTHAAAGEGGHAGGDDGLMDAFVRAVATRDRSAVSSGAAATLASHRAVFEIDAARTAGEVVTL